MPWKKTKPYRKPLCWAAVALFGLYTATAEAPPPCALPQAGSQVQRFASAHVSRPLPAALQSAAALALYPACFAPAVPANGSEGWPAEALKALQGQAYRSYVFWLRAIGWLGLVNAVWVGLFETASIWKGSRHVCRHE